MGCLSSKQAEYVPTDDAPNNQQDQSKNSKQQQKKKSSLDAAPNKPNLTVATTSDLGIRPEVEQALRAAGYSNSSASRGGADMQGIIALGSIRTSNSMPLSPSLLGGSRSVRGTPNMPRGIGADLGLIMDDQGMLNPMVRRGKEMHAW